MRSCSNAVRWAITGVVLTVLAASPAASPAAAQSVYGDRFVFSSTCEMSSGAGSPEGAVTGKPCDVYLQSDAATVAAVWWVKMTGTGTTTGWSQVVSSSALSGSGTSGYLPKWTGTATLGNSLISESGTAIAVAGSFSTTGVAALSTTSGTATIGQNVTTADALLGIGEGRTGNGYAYLDLVGDTNWTDYGLRVIRHNSGANAASSIQHRGTGQLQINAIDAGAINLATSNTARIIIEADGDVAVGTTGATQGKVEISNNAALGTFAALAFSALDGVYNPRAIISHVTATNDHYVQFSSAYTTGSGYADWVFATGNVGIGTTAPDMALDIVKTSDGAVVNMAQLLNSGTASGTGVRVLLGPYAESYQAAIEATGYPSSTYATSLWMRPRLSTGALGNGVFVATTDNVGIGNTSAGAKLEVTGDYWGIKSGSSPLILLGDSSSVGDYGYIRWNSGSDRLEIRTQAGGTGIVLSETNGAVGIGTVSPDTGNNVRLHVDGTAATLPGRIKISGAGSDATQADVLLETTATVRGTGLYTYDTQAAVVWYMGNPYSTGSAAWVLNYKPSAPSFATDTAQVGAAGVSNVLYATTTGVGIGGVVPTARLAFPAATTAAGGIAFGADVNLYRSATNVITTDDALTVGSSVTAAGAILPATADTYDLGSAALPWSAGHITSIYSTLFATTVQTLHGGYDIIGYNAGNLAAALASAASSADFGQVMVVGHFVKINALDSGGVAKTEYLQVGSLVSGTTYNVTRDLAGAHGTDPAWTSGTPYLVLGTTGTGRIELIAADNKPRLSMRTQGATYGASTEYVRLGDLEGFLSIAAGKMGLGLGDASAYLTYYDGTLAVKGSVTTESGTIGGWTLGATFLTAGSGATTVGLDSGGTNPAFYAGSATPASAPFRVTNAGAVTATSATITGTVNATSGYFGSGTNDVAIDSSGLTVGSEGRINSSGATAYGTGTGFWLGYDSSAYKWRVGNPIGDRLDWNGSALTIVQDGKQLGEWTSVAHSSGNFTAPLSMTWTVDSGDQYLYQYMILGKTMTVNVVLRNTSVGGTLTKALKIKIPASKIAAKSATALCWIKEHSGVSWGQGEVLVLASGDYYPDMPADWSTASDDDEWIWVFRSPAHAAYPSTSTDSTHLQFSITFEIT